MVADYLNAVPDTPYRESAQSLLDAIRGVDDAKGLVLSERESEILQRLFERQGDKQIASALGLTAHGVRYHLRNLFIKLGAGSRAEAVRRASEMGLALRESAPSSAASQSLLRLRAGQAIQVRPSEVPPEVSDSPR